ncbi:unnamed protein product [Callosobruchus maculatus]|uniref:Uncharacterized protein n=1 Tax=Callosobruchus maculatus TaxID=64391 RepID=A0A653DMD5_CALMS|nr:unnamed protein product [Callosobruchus maculatus]
MEGTSQRGDMTTVEKDRMANRYAQTRIEKSLGRSQRLPVNCTSCLHSLARRDSGLSSGPVSTFLAIATQ